MSALRLSFACWDYDRMKAIQDGRVRPEGIDLGFLPLRIEETFYRQLRHQEFDIAELSLSSYLLTLNEPEPPFVAIPVFPSRCFRHQSIYINARCGIDAPSDLVGKRVGTPEYQVTAGVWQRGILADFHGVPVDSVRYLTGAVEQSGRPEKLALDLPPGISVTPIGAGQNLSDMLAAGELDAIYSPAEPPCFGREPHIRRLFPDFKRAEQDYFRATRIFPIMHTVVVKRALHEREPWIAQSLTKAFGQSLQIAYQDLRERGALKVMLPWLAEHLAEAQDALGPGYWDYGLEPNRHVLETFARYSFEQGLAARRYAPEEMFAPGALESFRL
jgi:4,5-dihydroxyphthalate decarboxylase